MAHLTLNALYPAMFILTMSSLIFLALLYRHHRWHLNQRRQRARVANTTEWVEPTHSHPRNTRKADWVRHEVLRLKALMGKRAGCRAVAIAFNRLYGYRDTVGKSFVADLIATHRYEIACLRREIQAKCPMPCMPNAVWAMDLTFHRTQDGVVQCALGILDHGSRRALCLTTLVNRRAWTLLGHLCLAIGQYGKPKALRHDNEKVFHNFVFRTLLKLTGIRRQVIPTHSPWCNGRIERFFGTIKPLLRQLVIPNKAALQHILNEILYFYNHLRPHQNLGGLTPMEAWNGTSWDDVIEDSKIKHTIETVTQLDGVAVGFVRRE